MVTWHLSIIPCYPIKATDLHCWYVIAHVRMSSREIYNWKEEGSSFYCMKLNEGMKTSIT